MMWFLPALVVLVIGVAFFLFFKNKKSKKQTTVADYLAKPRGGFAGPLKGLFGGPSRAILSLLPELEETLLSADVGIETTAKLLNAIKDNSALKTSEEALQFLKSKIETLLTVVSPWDLPAHKPAVFFFVGINGTGKTTSIGKLAHYFKSQGKKVLLVAADTFRAAAMDQLKIWADRTGADFVGGAFEADPASVVFNGVKAALARSVDIVLIDTAGRLHTKNSLMEELKKMVRVAEKELGRPVDDIFMILDATTGQNGLSQVKVFLQTIRLTALILTKYDGTSKGGIVLPVVTETGLPLRFIGVGEGVNDLNPFDAPQFVKDLFE